MLMEYVFTFKNTNFAIKAEQLFLAEGLHVTVMPLPSQIKAGCGICLRIRPEEIRTALEVLERNPFEETGLYLKKNADQKISYSEILDRNALK